MSRPPAPRLLVSENYEKLCDAVAHAIAQSAARAVRTGGRFSIALAGGETPRGAYERLAALPLSWENVYLFWGDERWVPRQDPASNFRMVRQALLEKVPLSPGNVHAVDTFLPTIEEGAADYRRKLQEFFGGPPAFDLIMLGVGPDGHILSLFPGSEALEETSRPVTTARSPDGLARVTLTLPVVNRAASVFFMVSGAGKAPIVQRVCRGPQTAPALPAQRVQPEGSICWFIDRAAAAGAPEDVIA